MGTVADELRLFLERGDVANHVRDVGDVFARNIATCRNLMVYPVLLLLREIRVSESVAATLDVLREGTYVRHAREEDRHREIFSEVERRVFERFKDPALAEEHRRQVEALQEELRGVPGIEEVQLALAQNAVIRVWASFEALERIS